MKCQSHKYYNAAKDYEETHAVEKQRYINGLLKIIKSDIDECGGLIHFGNINLFIKDGTIMHYQSFEQINLEDEKQIENAIALYSEDGLDTLEDIANWVDIVENHLRDIRAEQRKSEKFMTEQDILNAILGLAHSQGSYGRLYEELTENPDELSELAERNFKSTLDLVLYLEEG